MTLPHVNEVLLRSDVRVGPDLDAWFVAGGGRGLRAALDAPSSLLTTIGDADLRGMGGAGFPTARKWAFVADAGTEGDRYVVCNGNEDEPGTFKDRVLLAETPHQVIEGALIAGLAVRANRIVLYVNPHATTALAACRAAIEQWSGHELLAAVEPHVTEDIDDLPVLDTPPSPGDAATIPWPDGDLIQDRSLPRDVDRAALQAASLLCGR